MQTRMPTHYINVHVVGSEYKCSNTYTAFKQVFNIDGGFLQLLLLAPKENNTHVKRSIKHYLLSLKFMEEFQTGRVQSGTICFRARF